MHLEKKERDALISEIMATVEDWDMDNLIGYVQQTMNERLTPLTLSELREEHKIAVGEE